MQNTTQEFKTDLRANILRTVRDNDVVILAGETGTLQNLLKGSQRLASRVAQEIKLTAKKLLRHLSSNPG